MPDPVLWLGGGTPPPRLAADAAEGENGRHDAEGGADGEIDLGGDVVEEVDVGSFEGETVGNEHDEEKQREADDGETDFVEVVVFHELGEGPGTEQSHGHADEVKVRHDGISCEEDGKTNPPGEIEDVSDRAHCGWKAEIGREGGGMLGADVAGLDSVDDSIAAGAGELDVVGFQGETLAGVGATGGAKGDVAPPGAVIPPKVVIGIVGGTADFETCGGGFDGCGDVHRDGHNGTLVFILPGIPPVAIRTVGGGRPNAYYGRVSAEFWCE